MVMVSLSVSISKRGSPAVTACSGPDGLVIERDVNAYMANRPAVTPLAANIAKAQGMSL